MISIAELDKVAFGNALWNASLYTPKVGITEGRVLFVGAPEGLDVYACDDFVTVRTRVTTEPCPAFSRLGTVESVKAAEKYLRENPLDELIVAEDSLQLNSDDCEISTIRYEFMEHVCWMELIDMVENDNAAPVTKAPEYYTWCLNLERLANLRRLKTVDDFPIDLRQMDFPGFENVALWQFMIGANIRGVISPMDRNPLKEKGVPLWS